MGYKLIKYRNKKGNFFFCKTYYFRQRGTKLEFHFILKFDRFLIILIK